MLNAIRDFFDKHVKPTAEADDDRHSLQVATAALLIEIVRMDQEIQEAERDAVLRAVRTKFGLTQEESESLVRLAEKEAQQATDYYQFTSLINAHFTPEQKEKVIEHMWQVAYADGELHMYEEHLVRKIADLLYVPHKVFIATKLRARAATRKP